MSKIKIIIPILMSVLLLSACGKVEKVQTENPIETTQETTSSENNDAEVIMEKAETFTMINGRVCAGIIFDDNQNMYVAKLDAIVKVSPNGEVSDFCSFKDIQDRKNFYFKSPLIWDMTFDNDGNILAAGQDRILKIASDGTFTTIIKEDFGGFLGVTGIECDSKGNMYITNGGKIEKYTPDLQKSTFIDGEKDSYSGFFSLEFDPDGKNLYVSDFYTKSLIKYEIDADGNAINTPTIIVKEPIKKSGDYGSPLNITFSENKTLYASIDGMATVMKMGTNGNIEFLYLGNSNIYNHIIAFGKNGFNEECLYITTLNGERVFKYFVGEKEYQ